VARLLSGPAHRMGSVLTSPTTERASVSLPGCAQGIFFIFIFFFVDLSKIYVGIIFFQKCHHAAGSIGGKELPPFDPAVPSMGHAPREDTAGSNGGTSLPPIDPAVSTTAAL